MPDPKVETAIDLAKDSSIAWLDLAHAYKAGGKREFDRNSPEGLRKSVSKCHDVNQKIIRAQDEQRWETEKLRKATERRLSLIKVWLGVLNAFAILLGAILANALQITEFLHRLTR